MTWESEWAAMEDSWTSCLGKIRSELDGFAESENIGDTEFFEPETGQSNVDTSYAKRMFGEVANGFLKDIELWMENEDWPRMGRAEVKAKFKDVLTSTYDGAEYFCDKNWGLEEKGPKKVPEGKTEEIIEGILDIFERGQEEFYAQIPVKERKRNAKACRQALKSMVGSFEICMKGRAEKLR